MCWLMHELNKQGIKFIDPTEPLFVSGFLTLTIDYKGFRKKFFYAGAHSFHFFKIEIL